MNTDKECIGCQACLDVCPCDAISFTYNNWGEGKALINYTKCKSCGVCEQICPSTTNIFNEPAKTVYAMFSKDYRRTGSSGGVFFEIANKFIEQGGCVYGAAFNDKLKLVHMKATTKSELIKLCKSKYIHSDMSGIYKDILSLLKNNIKVMFVGTPCQVSAVKNLFSSKYGENLLLVDFLCHGTGTQKVFDICIKAEENRIKGKIVDFTFRAKTRKAEHSYKYTFKKNKKLKIYSGYSFEFPYYNSYLKYNVFNEYCYSCKYAQNSRVGDITLGDFWGIQKHNKRLNDKDGVSMLAVNTQLGKKYFNEICLNCETYEYPIKTASDSNEAFYRVVSQSCHNSKLKLEDVLLNKGEEELIKQLSCHNLKKQIVYAITPDFVKKAWNWLRGRK